MTIYASDNAITIPNEPDGTQVLKITDHVFSEDTGGLRIVTSRGTLVIELNGDEAQKLFSAANRLTVLGK